MMEVGVNSPETHKVTGIAMEFPAIDGVELASPPRVPLRLRRRLSETKASSPASVEEIEAKLREASLRRQKFYESLSSKARPKPRSPPQSSHEEDLGHRLEAKLQAAEQKRLSILAKAQLRLAKLDELRQAARTGVEVRVKKECAELGTKVQTRVQQAESNRMRILKAYRQRRATLKERTSQSLLRRMARENKYKERVRAAIYQKRAAAEKKRLGLLEEDKKRAHARLMQVRKAAKSVSLQREIERRRLRESLEDKLQRARRQRAEYLMQRARLHNSIGASWNKKMQKQAELLSRKLARCWRKFLKQRTTVDLAKAYDALSINTRRVTSIPFEQLALLIESASTLQTTKAFLDRLECRYKVSLTVASATSSHGQNDINHLLKRVVSPSRKTSPRISFRSRDGKKSTSARESANSTVKLSRYQVRVVLCAYMILGHPDAVFSGRGERESALAQSAEKFVQEFELLVKIILDGPEESFDEERDPSLHKRRTFRSQLAVFDAAWCSYLNSFVVWKVKDAESLEEDLVRAACQLEFSMMQKCKLTPEGDAGDLTYDMKAIQRQVTEDQKLLREKVMHLSGDAGIERMQNALSDTRSKYFQAKENGSPVGSPVAHIFSPSSPSSPPAASSVTDTQKRRYVAEGTEGPSHIVRSLFKDGASSPPLRVVGFSPPSSNRLDSQVIDSGEMLGMENELIVNEFVHGQQPSLSDSLSSNEDKNTIKVRETMEKAFWDGITESIRKDKPEYGRVVELMREVRDELCKMAPASWKQNITEAIDLEILSQLLNSGNLDMDYLGKIMEFALVSLQKLSAVANENKLKEAHQKVLRELADICLAGDGSNQSHVVALIQGLRFVLEQIKVLKQEISKARIRIMEPFLKGPAGLEYLGKAFAKHFGPPSDALVSLPLTIRWLSSVWPIKDQEWGEHTRALSELTSMQESLSLRHLPSTTLRTGGNFSAKMSSATATDTKEKQLPECKGEKVDLAVRLGLLKLVSEVSGVAPEELPETLSLNFVRLRAVQAQLQKITVIATSVLVLRQTLLIEQMVGSAEEMESIGARCVEQLTTLLDTVEDAGIKEVVETISKIADECDKSGDTRKTESRKDVIARMLTKSVQAGDPIFTRVSRAIYVAARGVVLGGTGGRARDLVEMALRQVGAAALTNRVVEAAKVLVVIATVTGRVHELWYAQLTANM